MILERRRGKIMMTFIVGLFIGGFLGISLMAIIAVGNKSDVMTVRPKSVS